MLLRPATRLVNGEKTTYLPNFTCNLAENIKNQLCALMVNYNLIPPLPSVRAQDMIVRKKFIT